MNLPMETIKTKTLEIALDNGVKHTRYFILSTGGNGLVPDKFFEGIVLPEHKYVGPPHYKSITPLKEAKLWAKEQGYTHLQVTRISRGKNKFYTL